METILLMLSGGVDSTCLLYYYLTETDHPVHVHHISQRYPQLQRWKMEDPAVERIVDYCRRTYRPFDYSASRFDMEPLTLVGYDQTLHLLVASKVAPNLAGDKVSVALGHCYDDFDTPEARALGKLKTMDKLWRVLKESCVHEGHRLNPERTRPFFDLKWTKEDICRKMPDELMRLCWSCRRPEYIDGQGVPCGSCKTCNQLESILKESGRAEAFPNLVRSKQIAERRVAPHDRQVRAGGAPSLSLAPNRNHGSLSARTAHRLSSPHQRGLFARGAGKAESLELQVKVALAALQEDESDAQIADRYDVAPASVGVWKGLLLRGIADCFKQSLGAVPNTMRLKSEIDALQRKVQQLEARLKVRSSLEDVRAASPGTCRQAPD